MRLTRLALTNFKSFQNKQVIDLAPVTLLFGPNSVGKSSVLMALAYVQQILTKGHCNPQKLDALGDKAIGGFRSLLSFPRYTWECLTLSLCSMDRKNGSKAT